LHFHNQREKHIGIILRDECSELSESCSEKSFGTTTVLKKPGFA